MGSLVTFESPYVFEVMQVTREYGTSTDEVTMAKNIIGSTVCGAMLTLLVQQSAMAAITDYVATGSFYGASLEVTNFDEQTGEEVFVDAFLSAQPLNLSASPSFTLTFSVDESVNGTVPIFSAVALFNNALSNVSLDINGVNVLTSTETDRVQQFPGNNGFPSRWSWGLFAEDLALPAVEVFDSQTGEFITNLNAEFMNFALFDSTDTVYAGGFPIDLITASLGDFTSTDFSLFWGLSSGDENGDPFGDFAGDASYRVLGNIETLAVVSEVPVPAAAWLFLSAIGGLVASKRRQLRV